MTTAVLNPLISKMENKISNTSSLVTKTVINTKIMLNILLLKNLIS